MFSYISISLKVHLFLNHNLTYCVFGSSQKRNILRFPALETIVHAHSNEREDSERSRVKDDEISK